MSVLHLIEICRERNVRMATAESCTGGMIAALLTDIPGSSDVFERGYVTYSNEAKHDLLGVSPETLARFGAVSKAVAREMAEGALRRSRANLAVAVTGVAGPGRSEHKPEGRVCFGLAAAGRSTLLERRDFGSIGRKAVRERSRDHAIHMLIRAVSTF